MGTVTCPECGHDKNEAFFKICVECGADLFEPSAPSAQPESATEDVEAAVAGDGGARVEAAPVPTETAVAAAESGDAATPTAQAEVAADSAPTVHCSACGSEVEPGFRFCAVCGAPLDAVEEAQPAVPVEGEQEVAARPEAGRLVVIRPDQSEGRSFVLYEGQTVLGRRGGDIEFPDDPFLEDNHAMFELSAGGQAVLRPGATRNGVFVRIDGPVQLADGAEIRIGQHLLQVEVFESNAPVLRGPAGELAIGSPWPKGLWGRLSVVAAGGRVARAWLLLEPEVLIGRRHGQILLADDPFASGRHAVLRRTERGAVIEDVGSRNGTYVRVHDPVALTSGTVLLAGQQLFRVQLGA